MSKRLDGRRRFVLVSKSNFAIMQAGLMNVASFLTAGAFKDCHLTDSEFADDGLSGCRTSCRRQGISPSSIDEGLLSSAIPPTETFADEPAGSDRRTAAEPSS
jgi:hypothetical protein